jgi:hypothetical protein
MNIKNRPPAGEAYIWLTRDLLASDAWRSLSINAHRFVDFLMIEHMANGGQHNGKLKAPHRQLRALGIDAHYVAGAIREAEEVGLVDCIRGGMRIATMYALTWLPLYDGTPASNRWRAWRNPHRAPLRAARARYQPRKGKANGTDRGGEKFRNLHGI